LRFNDAWTADVLLRTHSSTSTHERAESCLCMVRHLGTNTGQRPIKHTLAISVHHSHDAGHEMGHGTHTTHTHTHIHHTHTHTHTHTHKHPGDDTRGDANDEARQQVCDRPCMYTGCRPPRTPVYEM
jgi:hypothetical protein